MKTKLLSLVFTAFILSLALVCAATNFTATSPAILSQSSNSTTFTITALANATLTIPSTATFENTVVSISPNGAVSVDTSTPRTITVATTSFPVALGTSLSKLLHSGSILISNAAIPAENQTIPITFATSYCKYGDVQNGTSRYIDIISVRDTTSDTAWKWKPGDSVNVDIKIDYNNDAKSDDEISSLIQIGLYDEDTGKFLDFDNQNDLDDISETLSEGSTNRFTYTLDVPIQDLDSTHTYQLMIKAFQDGKESTLCTDKVDNWDSPNYAQPIDLSQKTHEVILKDALIDSPAPCGQEIVLSTTAWNIGANDEDRVYVQAFNKELGINFTTDAFVLNQGEFKKLAFNFIIPTNASVKTYPVYFTAYYSYSKSSDEYREDSDVYQQSLKVENCVPPVSSSITAQLNPDTQKAVIGGQVIVDAVITNTGKTSATYTVSVSGNTAWSTLAKIDPQTITLEAGAEKTVSIYLNVANTAAEGAQTFTIKSVSGSYETDKNVQLTLEKGFVFSWDGIANHFKNNWMVYVIVLVNLILIIAIVMVIVRIFRRSSA